MNTLRKLIHICSLPMAATFLVGMLVASPAHGGLWDSIKNTAEQIVSPKTGSDSESSTISLSQEEVAQGLIEALKVGSEQTVSLVSATDGFLDNPLIHIPLPDKIQSVASVMRNFGMGSQVDTFETTMNRAAESASKEALPVLSQAIQQLTFDDVMEIWKGENDAATQYFKGKTTSQLQEKFRPIVEDAVQQTGVTKVYQNMISAPAVSTMFNESDLDLNKYVTEKTVDGLFVMLAKEEEKIRTEPVAQTTDLLKKLFGSSN